MTPKPTPRYDKLEPRHREWDSQANTWSRQKIDDLLCETLHELYEAEFNLAAATEKLSEANAARERAEEDARRLDWIETIACGLTIHRPGEHGGALENWLVTVEDSDGYASSEHEAPTLRAAIDAALAGSDTSGGKDA